MGEGAVRLQEAVHVVELAGPVALERLRTVLASAQRLKAAQLAAVRDLDSRELYALDAAGQRPRLAAPPARR